MASPPPPIGAYVWNGTAWIPQVASGSSGSVGPYIPGVGLYGQNASGNWVPMNPIGSLQIAQQVLAAPLASITFSSIPQNFTNLQITLTGATSDTAVNTDVAMQFNGDTGNNYQVQIIGAASGSTTASQLTSTYLDIGGLASATATGLSGSLDILLPAYAKTTFSNKDALCRNVRPDNAGGTASATILWGGRWLGSNAAITSVKFAPTTGSNFVTGTIATLYGLA